MTKRWVTGEAFEVMKSVSRRLPEESYFIPCAGDVFHAGDEVLVRDEDGVEFVGILVVRVLGGSEPYLRVQKKGYPISELWGYWRNVVGWRRP